MPVLVARLSGPLQSWGAEPKLKTATTHPTPTWSGVLGLLRAAVGHGRGDDLHEIAWLQALTCAVRVDHPGRAMVDFHTINPLPEIYEQFAGVGAADRGIVPIGTTLQKGTSQKGAQAPRWFSGTVPAVTRRHYLQDAAFLLLLEGPGPDLERLAQALTSPRWTLHLGRKGCTPASPVLLGVHPGGIVGVARLAPIATRKAPTGQVDLVWLHGTPDPALPVERKRVVLDQPLGPHPQHGYAAGQHTVTPLILSRDTVFLTDDDPAGLRPPNEPAPAPALNGSDALRWAMAHLTHPARPQETPA